jgi:transcriptional regulator with AAA-type ATPase domain
LPFDIIENLQLYLWPGNVRELKRVLENLHSLFGPDRLRLDHLKAVFSLGGQEIQQPTVSTSKNSGVGKKNIEELAASLHQLKCAREVLRSLEIQLEQFRTQTEESPRLVFKFGISELETLCRQPSLFGDSFSDVWSLLEKLNWFQESIVTKINRTEKVTEPLLIEMLKRVQAILSMATKDIIKSIL